MKSVESGVRESLSARGNLLDKLYQTKEVEFIKEEKGSATYTTKTVAYCNVPELINEICKLRKYQRDKVRIRVFADSGKSSTKIGISVVPESHDR